MEFRHVLFPVDFSRRAHGAAPRIKALARRFDAKVTLLHTADLPGPWFVGMEAPMLPEIQWPEIEEEATKRMAQFAAAEFAGELVNTVVEQGDPGTGIVDFAAENDVDLIALPTHGRGMFRAALLGSVTAKVLHDALCPVWTDAHAEEVSPTNDGAWHSILCAIDTGKECGNLLRAGAELRDRFGATVRLVHAVPGAEAGQERYLDLDFQRFLEDSARKSIAGLQQEAGTNFDVCLGAGSPSRVVAEAALHHDADLVVIGHGHLRGVAGRLRTHAYGIIRSAPCPVLSL